MDDRIKKGLEENRKRIALLKEQEDMEHSRDRRQTEAAIRLWESLKGAVANTAQDASREAILRGDDLFFEYEIKDGNCYAVRSTAPRFGFILSFDEPEGIVTAQYNLRSNGKVENKGIPIRLYISIERDGEPGFLTEAARMEFDEKTLTVNEVSVKLLIPLIVGDLREVLKQGLVSDSALSGRVLCGQRI